MEAGERDVEKSVCEKSVCGKLPTDSPLLPILLLYILHIIASCRIPRTATLALKVQKSAPHYTEAASDEVQLLQCVSRKKASSHPPTSTFHCVELSDSFFHAGPNGNHMCMVFSLHGQNLLWLIKEYDYKGVPTQVVRKVRGATATSEGGALYDV